MEREIIKETPGADFWKWIVGILVSAISFFLIKTSNKLDNMEDLIQKIVVAQAVQEQKNQTSAEKTQKNSDNITELYIRISKVEEEVRQTRYSKK